ncbi:DUF4898 domain-containing protein [Sulfolobus sp. E5-1-F]|uniref:DUF4898 domain-containing protein n=1 Tax=Sulfolobaceae TaxID=118883 RepID=UPI0012957ADB|nr:MULTISPECIES: DUF4898 domain-containing protein [unclassified Sulfolobus]QGA53243.1 DUF4898 domain-containing protein [Sulfolobus sp. E5-1-F]QGA68363.1 DUF4898 domain-containing protein [Sulfolobus sp. E11-6]
MLTNSAGTGNLEDFIMTVARSREIFNLKSYSLRIISDYTKFFNLILPKDVRDVLVILPTSRDDLGNTIKNELTRIRTSCSIIVLYSTRVEKDRMVIGFRVIASKTVNSEANSDKNRMISMHPEPQGSKTHLNLYSLGITF